MTSVFPLRHFYWILFHKVGIFDFCCRLSLRYIFCKIYEDKSSIRPLVLFQLCSYTLFYSYSSPATSAILHFQFFIPFFLAFLLIYSSRYSSSLYLQAPFRYFYPFIEETCSVFRLIFLFLLIIFLSLSIDLFVFDWIIEIYDRFQFIFLLIVWLMLQFFQNF